MPESARPPLSRRLQARFFRVVNVPMRLVLGLPVATPLGRNLMLAFIVGRKTGRLYRQPVSYVRDGDATPDTRRRQMEAEPRGTRHQSGARRADRVRGCPVFISDNPAYDWQWIAGMFDRAGMDNPFGHSGRSIGDFWAGLNRNWSDTQGWKRLFTAVDRAYGVSCNGHTSTTPCATAQGVRETISTASASVGASMIANPATGREEDMNGPAWVTIPAALWLRT